MFEHFKVHREMLLVDSYKSLYKVALNFNSYKWGKLQLKKKTFLIPLKLLQKHMQPTLG